MRIAFFLVLLVVVAFTGCDTGVPPPEPDPRGQTTFRGFRFAPSDTVVLGDTVTVTALIADSLDARFEYCWLSELNSSPSDFVPEASLAACPQGGRSGSSRRGRR